MRNKVQPTRRCMHDEMLLVADAELFERCREGQAVKRSWMATMRPGASRRPVLCAGQGTHAPRPRSSMLNGQLGAL